MRFVIFFLLNILIFSPLLQIAAEVAAPLAKTEEIVLLSGGSNMTAEISKLVTQVPAAINALTGVDLSQVIHCPIN